MKKLVSIMLIAAAVTLYFSGMCFAEEMSVPAHLNITASVVDFSVNQKINMNAETAGKPDLTIDSLVITNTGSMGKVKLDSVKVTPTAGWTLAADSTDFINMSADQQTFSIVADGTHDFSEDGVMTSGKTASPAGKITVEFTGKTGAVTSELKDIQVATIVATVSLA